MTQPANTPWAPVAPLAVVNGSLAPQLATVDSLQRAWAESISRVSPSDFTEARLRSLRRHAIETGILERLYDVSWGVTEALVAEGLTLEAAAQSGGIDEDTLATVRSQFDALEFLSGVAREGQELTVFLIRELHALITRHQVTYEATDSLGRVVRVPLHHGQWKKASNHVRRPDGTLLEYAPWEQVQSEMERLLELYEETESAHPIVRAAWLHHRFIRIHPFEDGNGRVGRALVLLTLLRADYAPLVIENRRRDDYLLSLDVANEGDLAPLVRLFAEREIVALRSELEPTEAIPPGAGAVDVARAYVKRLRGLREGTADERAAGAARLANDLQALLDGHLTKAGQDLQAAFVEIDEHARFGVESASPPDERARFWHAQLVRLASRGDFFSNLADGSWWTRLNVVVLRHQLRYVSAVQKVGRGETGVLAVTVFGELVLPRDDAEDRPIPEWLFEPTSEDSVTLTHTDVAEQRWNEVSELVDRSLAAAVAAFGRQLG